MMNQEYPNEITGSAISDADLELIAAELCRGSSDEVSSFEPSSSSSDMDPDKSYIESLQLSFIENAIWETVLQIELGLFH